MKKSSFRFFPVLAGFLFLMSVSCREEIIIPDNFSGNVNEPLEANNFNSYTFLIDAKEVNVDYSKRPDFTSFTTRIIITINDYSSGSIRIRIKDNQSNDRFSYSGSKDEELYTELLEGFIPDLVEIKTTDFSGKLKIQLNAAY